MTRTITIIFCLLTRAFAFGEDIIVPSPAIMLEESNLIAKGSLRRNRDGWDFIIVEPLKGSQKIGQSVRLESHFSLMSFSFEGLARLVGSDLFLFVGKYDETLKVARPSYGNCSAWPQGTMPVLLPQRTLDDVMTFAKKSLALSDSDKKVPEIDDPRPLQTTSKLHAEEPIEAKSSSVSQSSETTSSSDSKSRAATPSVAPVSTQSWSVITALIVAGAFLLWLLLRKRK